MGLYRQAVKAAVDALCISLSLDYESWSFSGNGASKGRLYIHKTCDGSTFDPIFVHNTKLPFWTGRKLFKAMRKGQRLKTLKDAVSELKRVHQ